jgi:outer membrane protein assembly factor BamA
MSPSRRRQRLLWLAVLFGSLLALGCAPLPPGRYTLDALHIRGNQALDDDEIEEVIASRESARFLGLFSGFIYEYEIFDRYVLERDLERIQRYYRARGYYEALVRAARVVYKGRGAKVYVEVEEGPPVRLARVDIHGIEPLPARAQARVRAAVASDLPVGKPFEEASLEAAAKTLTSRLENHGYAYANVRRSADVDLPGGRAAVGFWVELGPKARFGSVRIEGLGPLPEGPVRRALNLKPGDPYSRAELDEAKRAVLDLAVFSAVSIEPDIKDPAAKPTEVPILVKVERSKLRSVRLGGGVQLDTQRTDVHLIAGYENNNLFGGFRHFLIEGVPGLVLYPTRLPNFQTPRRLLPELRIRSEFRQPGFVEARTNLLLRAEASVYPVLLTSDYNPAAPVLGYRDLRTSAGLERSMWRLYGALSQNEQVSSPFTYIGALDPNLGTVLISYPELFLSLDLRNDRVAPHQGAYLSFDTQIAGLGGDARDVKIQPEARGYVPISRRVTLAARATTGFLFPQNYGKTVAPNAATGTPGAGVSDGDWVHDIQLMFLRGFFSGGSGSNRGYGFREIGPHGVVPFYNPGQSGTSITTDCRMADPEQTPPECNLPLGGFTLWEASLELRFPLTGPLSGAVFGDTSDVSPNKVDYRFNRPHLSVGFGFRYETPIGPVRFDLGYRVPGAQAPKTRDEVQPHDIFGVPVAASFGIGEAF